jgi:hypothetical protein
MRIYFTKEYWKVFGIAAAVLTVFILGIGAYSVFNNRNGEYMEYENEYGGKTLRVSKEKGGFSMPKEFPSDIVDIYPNLRLRDVYIIKNKNNEIVELQVEAFSDDDTDTVKKYYEDEDKRIINKNYKGVFNVRSTNSEYLPKNKHVSEKTELFLNVKKAETENKE